MDSILDYSKEPVVIMLIIALWLFKKIISFLEMHQVCRGEITVSGICFKIKTQFTKHHHSAIVSKRLH